MMKKLYKPIALFLALSLISVLSCKKSEEARPVEPTTPTRTTPPTAKLLEEGKFTMGQPAPDLSWGYEANQRLSVVRGNVLLVHFFAPDAEICKKQLEILKELWQRRNRTGLVVIGLMLGNNAAALNDLVTAGLLPYPYAWAGRDLVDVADGLPAIPTTVVIDRSGRVVKIVMGIRDLETWEVNLAPLLSSPPQAPAPAG